MSCERGLRSKACEVEMRHTASDELPKLAAYYDED